jgi:flagellar motor switch protein FliG
MNSKHAANVLSHLDPDVRTDAIVFLTQESTVPLPIVNQVLKTTVLKAISVEFREEVIDQSQTLAELMRSLPKEMRVELMAKLEETNPELSESVKSRLYLFVDVMRLDDRDVQKLLGEIESDSLIVALQRTNQNLIDKLLSNLSKRARESITEEMQYKVNATDEEVEEARGQLISAIARLDENGEIKLK